jgi:hypothetical protein
MTALELLEEQHREVDDTIARILEAEDADEKQRLFDKLADAIAAHGTIEEKRFYPAVRNEQTEDLIKESYDEHAEIKELLAEMMDLDIEDDEFEDQLAVLQEKITKHAHEEEEGELFPRVLKSMALAELEALGKDLRELYETEMQSEPRSRLPQPEEEQPAIEAEAPPPTRS